MCEQIELNLKHAVHKHLEQLLILGKYTQPHAVSKDAGKKLSVPYQIAGERLALLQNEKSHEGEGSDKQKDGDEEEHLKCEFFAYGF